ncbi:4-demethylwyosine synthase TYW1 [Candidatus Bathyarchaeota archaeon]|nr:4-demethylwyosine synthase TYW1 [Candidatus Bathyarchaeota archaeon]
MISKEAIHRFSNAGYRIVGRHSAVDICHWTKESLRKDRVCYKEKWYGIESHRCMEITPSLIWCTNKCQFCWRPLEYTICDEPEADDPKEIIDGCIKARSLLLTGFKGNPNVDKRKWNEAINPTNAAISLAGEPTLYSRISELIDEFKKRGITTFLVTNGTRPDRLQTLTTEPTNLYISLCAPDQKTYMVVNRPLIKQSWEKLNKSLELMKSFNCRTVLRLTLVKGLNLKGIDNYAKLILKAEPNFVEPKAFMHIGEAQNRLPRVAMPTHQEIIKFSQRLSKLISYRFKDHSPQSRVVLLSKN